MPYTFRPHERRVIDALAGLGRAVAVARIRQGLSQEALEARSGTDLSTISRFGRGQAPGLRLDRVAQILAGLVVEELVVPLRSDPRRFR